MNFVGSTSPTLVTPVLGAATATTVAFSPTTGGIIGTTTNDDADSGIVGELITSVILAASAVSLTTVTPGDITSISLTAGDWDVFGNISFEFTGANTVISAAINSTSATFPDFALYSQSSTGAGTLFPSLICPYSRVSLSGTTTYYLIAQSAFTGGTSVACGGIFARRVR